MKLQLIQGKGSWRDAADAARTTIGLEEGTGEPSSSWKLRMLLAEHSPIRQVLVRWKWVDLKYWVSVHFVRHKVGIEHFVSTQRTDRTSLDRDRLPQSALVNHECIADAQAIINISRKRLCRQASPDTQEAWRALLASLEALEPELAAVCVPECIYRGFCPELKPCGFTATDDHRRRLAAYRSLGTPAAPVAEGRKAQGAPPGSSSQILV